MYLCGKCYSMVESRVKKSLLNARVNLIFHFISLALAFFSRKIFLDCLGVDFVGLTGTIGNMLQFLNLAELGIGTAFYVSLYKPLFEQNRDKINEIISVLGYLYQKLGLFMLIAGFIVGLFFPLIFKNTSLPLEIIYFTYVAYLSSSLFTYFINYKQTLLSADQKNYIVSAYLNSARAFKVIAQIVITYYTHNYYYWIVMEILFGISYCFILNWKIKQIYPWLEVSIGSGRKLLPHYKETKTKIKQIAVQRISFFAYEQALPLIIFGFTSLQVVAYYNNYILVTSALTILIYHGLGGMEASVGNLIAENNTSRTMSVFWEIYSFRFFVASVCIFSTYHLITPFICLWLGEKYILNSTILILILINMFIRNYLETNYNFIRGYGLFNDVWASYTEAGINVSLAITLGYFYGITGVLIGGITGTALNTFIWKPYFLFKNGFKQTSSIYYKRTIKYTILLVIAWIIAQHLLSFTTISIHNFSNFILSAIINMAIISITFGIILYIFTKETRCLCKRIMFICTNMIRK